VTAGVFPFHVGMPAVSWKATGQYDEVRTCTNTESPFDQPCGCDYSGRIVGNPETMAFAMTPS
jgi:hypothetical protein